MTASAGLASGSASVTVTASGAEIFVLTCPSPDEIQAIDRELTLSFINDLTEQRPLVCTEEQGSADLTEVQWMAYQALRMMKATEFTEPLPWTSSLYDWLVDTIDGIDYDSTEEYSFCCRDQRIVIAVKLVDEVDTYFLSSPIYWYRSFYETLLYGWDTHFEYAGSAFVNHIQLLVHEARHSEGPVHTGGDGRDKTFEEMGSWAYATQVSWWYATKFQHTDFFGSHEVEAILSLLRDACSNRFTEGSCPEAWWG